jgi:hypothetical protein
VSTLTCYSTSELKTALTLGKTSLTMHQRIDGGAEFELVEEMPFTRAEIEAELARRVPDPARLSAFFGAVRDWMEQRDAERAKLEAVTLTPVDADTTPGLAT